MTTVAIHQPNFLPWQGYFQKIRQADVFCFLDDVQFPLGNRGCVVNRTGTICNGEQKWLTLPITRAERILDVCVRNREEPLEKVRNWYRGAPFFKDAFPIIEKVLLYEATSLADFNIHAIKALCEVLGISATFVRSSELNISSQKQERIIDIVKTLGGDIYLSGKNAANYQTEEAFTSRGVELRYIVYDIPPYPQFNSTTFIPGLSILDKLMNCGVC